MTKLEASTSAETARQLWPLYVVLIAVAVGQASGRLLAVNSVDRQHSQKVRVQRAMASLEQELVADGVRQPELAEILQQRRPSIESQQRIERPFLSANDRSRWLGVRALVEQGRWHIDQLVEEPGWDTIDKVRHVGPDGQMHYYSSKPPWSYLPQAGLYWVLHRTTGWTLGEHPYLVGRVLLMLTNVPMFALTILLVAGLAERYGQTDFAKLFMVACMAFGTMISAFVVVLNNHLVAACFTALLLFAWTKIKLDQDRRSRWFVCAGLAAAMTATNELPALAMLLGVGGSLLLTDARKTLVGYAPAALLVLAGFFATNYSAHQSLRPPYMHRDASDPADNWYLYPGSYWIDRPGIDAGEPSRWDYLVHTTFGHHGVFSLTPIWLLSLAGGIVWLRYSQAARRELAFGTLALSLVVLTFYIGLRPQEDRNYGGMTSGLRWLFWLAPLWITLMAPLADWASRRPGRQAFALVLLGFSALSAAYPTWNPWTQPWIHNWLEWCGFDMLG